MKDLIEGDIVILNLGYIVDIKENQDLSYKYCYKGYDINTGKIIFFSISNIVEIWRNDNNNNLKIRKGV